MYFPKAYIRQSIGSCHVNEMPKMSPNFENIMLKYKITVFTAGRFLNSKCIKNNVKILLI